MSTSAIRREALTDPDVRRMLEVREGSAAAFEELVLRYQARVITVLEHLVGDRDLAEDLAQDVFMRVYRARATYEPGSRFSTWLFTIANNVGLTALRHRGRRREVHLAPSNVSTQSLRPLERIALAGSAVMPARRLDKDEMRAMVRQAVQVLSERQRMAVLLHKFEGMSYQDIAETMRLSTKAVKSLLARARENLREALSPYLEDSP